MDRFRFKSRVYSTADRFAFILAFLAGAVFIVIARTLGFDWLAVMLSVLVIAAYTVYISKFADRTSISFDQAADNAYYLGLLFTLLVLVYSLWKASRFTIITGGTPADIYASNRFLSLLPDFGIALVSTITGIACRVVLQQFRNDPADMEIRARQELGSAIQDFRTSLLAAVSKFNDTSKAMSAAFEKMEKRTKETLEKSLKASTESLSQLSRKADDLFNDFSEQVKPAGESIKSFADVVDTAADNMKKANRRIDTVTASAAQGLKTLSTDIEKVRQQMKSTRGSHQTFSDELSNLAAKFSSFISKDFLNQMHSMQNKTLEQQKQLVSRLNALDEDLVRIGQALNGAGSEISGTTEELEKQLASQFGAIKNSADQIGQKLSGAGSRISGTTEELEKQLTSQFGTIKSNAEQIGQKLDGISYKVPSIVAGIERAEASGREVMPQLRDASIQLIDSQQEILSAFKSIQKKIQQMDKISGQALENAETKKKFFGFWFRW